jgi:rare lipoprotein A (peptidoglycan hydrolase)
VRTRAAAASALFLCAALFAAAQAASAKPAAAAPQAAALEGTASWYGPGFHGKRTASGEIYDKEGLTAAHKTLPFGTYLRVSSLDSGSSVVVRVNDRGPYAKGRVVDLSEAAARIIGMIPSGTARVRLEVIPEDEALAWKGGSADGSPAKAGPRGASGPGAAGAPRAAGVERVRIQVASYADESNARATVRRLALSGIEAAIEEAGSAHRVVIAGLSVERSREVAQRLDALGYRGYTVTTIKP